MHSHISCNWMSQSRSTCLGHHEWPIEYPGFQCSYLCVCDIQFMPHASWHLFDVSSFGICGMCVRLQSATPQHNYLMCSVTPPLYGSGLILLLHCPFMVVVVVVVFCAICIAFWLRERFRPLFGCAKGLARHPDAIHFIHHINNNYIRTYFDSMRGHS